MRVELTEVLWLDEHHEWSLTELAEVSGLSEAELHELVDGNVIVPVDPGATQRTFCSECIVTARTARRLRDDFELDAQGMVLALALLDRIRDLEAQLRNLRAQLPGRIR
ncbi:MAG: hypothetical protein H0V62_05420 [Gammaproteobacteria bacterium]|nr:hypothetical protein [Gammaproteobacteria bacterium]